MKQRRCSEGVSSGFSGVALGEGFLLGQLFRAGPQFVTQRGKLHGLMIDFFQPGFAGILPIAEFLLSTGERGPLIDELLQQLLKFADSGIDFRRARIQLGSLGLDFRRLRFNRGERHGLDGCLALLRGGFRCEL